MTQTLIVSTFGDNTSGGGLFAIRDGLAERLDRMSSTGLAYANGRLLRAIRCKDPEVEAGEIVIYDTRGVQRYLRLDNTAAIHQVAWDGEEIVICSTGHNAIRWFSPAGKLLREVRYPGERDCWHLNGLAAHDGAWYATYFGAHANFREWDFVAHLGGTGRLVELKTGRIVLSGLSRPHSPCRVDDLWIVCNSEDHSLLAMDATSGEVVQRVDLGHWTRGFAFDEAFLYVGANRRRHAADLGGDALVAVIDRTTWKQVEQIAIPSQEIFDLALVPAAMVDGLRRGFDVNPTRTSEYRQSRVITELGCAEPRMLWPSGEQLQWSDFRCAIVAELPASVPANGSIELPVRVTNASASFFACAPPCPVYLSYKWIDPSTGAFVDDRRALRTRLPRAIFPHETQELVVTILAPVSVGRFILRLTLVQEGVAWFDDVDSSGAIEASVEVGEHLPPVHEPTLPIRTSFV